MFQGKGAQIFQQSGSHLKIVRHQMGDMQQVPWGATKIRNHYTKLVAQAWNL